MTTKEITASIALGMAHCLLGSAIAGGAVSLLLLVLVRALN